MALQYGSSVNLSSKFDQEIRSAFFVGKGGVDSKWNQIGTNLGKRRANMNDFLQFWATLGPTLITLGSTLATLGSTWITLGHIGANLDHLGTILEPIWVTLGPTWATLGPTWVTLGPTWATLGPTWATLGSTCGPGRDQNYPFYSPSGDNDNYDFPRFL